LGTFTFSRDGGGNLIDNTVTLTKISSTLYRLGNLSALNTQLGSYVLTLSLAAVQDIVGNSASNQVSSSWTLINSTPNRAPTINSITNRVYAEGFRGSFQVVASDIDTPPQTLTFSLGTNAPAGARIDPATGVFAWRPSSSQGPAAYPISVIVSDNGQPSMSATQSLVINVQDRLPDVVLSLGNTNLAIGQTSSVPLRIDTGVDLTNLTFEVEASPSWLGNLAAQTVSGDILGMNAQLLTSNRMLIALILKSSIATSSNQTLLRLSFAATTNDVTGAVALNFSPLQATRRDGTTVTNTLGNKGRVIVVGSRPYLEALATNRSLNVYGKIGTNYVIECATNLNQGAVWLPAATVLLSNQMQQAGLPLAPLYSFYRARQSEGASLALLSSSADGLNYQLTGQTGTSYLVEYSTNSNGPWTLLARVPQTSVTQNLTLNLDATNRIYRVREFIANPPVIELSRQPATNLSLLLYGRPDAVYELSSSSNLVSNLWQSLSNFTLPASFQTIDLGLGTNNVRFYRVMEPQR
jgi:hypothetical protein